MCEAQLGVGVVEGVTDLVHRPQRKARKTTTTGLIFRTAPYPMRKVGDHLKMAADLAREHAPTLKAIAIRPASLLRPPKLQSMAGPRRGEGS